MYIQKTKYYCPDCRTHDHWADEPCKEKANVPTGSPGVAVEQSQTGDEVCQREGNHPGGETLLQGETSEKGVESGGCPDPREAELRGKAVHQEVQKSRRTVPRKKNPVEAAQELIKRLPGRPRIYPDAKIRRRAYMRKYRAKVRA